MKEKEIEKILQKFERILGPVARKLATELAEEKNILRENKISPASQEEYTSFLTKLADEYSKITNRELVEKMLEKAKAEL